MSVVGIAELGGAIESRTIPSNEDDTSQVLQVFRIFEMKIGRVSFYKPD